MSRTRAPKCPICGAEVDLEDAWPVFDEVCDTAEHAREFAGQLVEWGEAVRAAEEEAPAGDDGKGDGA